jgi:hypothetical protein
VSAPPATPPPLPPALKQELGPKVSVFYVNGLTPPPSNKLIFQAPGPLGDTDIIRSDNLRRSDRFDRLRVTVTHRLLVSHPALRCPGPASVILIPHPPPPPFPDLRLPRQNFWWPLHQQGRPPLPPSPSVSITFFLTDYFQLGEHDSRSERACVDTAVRVVRAEWSRCAGWWI